MHNDPRLILPGDRVIAFDARLYKNDLDTPLDVTMKEGVVVARYGYLSSYMEKEYGREAAKYPDLVDIRFDHRPELISRGHFTTGVEPL